MADAFDNAIAGLANTPAFYYPFSDPAGDTNIEDTGGFNIDVTTNGVVTLGADPVVEGGDTSAYQDKDTHMAARADNGILDADGTKLSLCCVIVPLNLKAAPALISKANAYTLSVVGSSVKSTLQGVTPSSVTTNPDLVMPGSPSFIVMTMDGPGGLWRIYVNGVLALSQGISTSSTHVGGSANLELGGHSSFGNSGISGRFGKVGIWVNHALSVEQIRTVYEAPWAAGESAERVFAMPWSRLAISGNADRQSVKLTNGSDVPVWASQSATAVVGAGDYIAPYGGHVVWEGYTGVGSVIAESVWGAKAVGIREVSA